MGKAHLDSLLAAPQQMHMLLGYRLPQTVRSVLQMGKPQDGGFPVGFRQNKGTVKKAQAHACLNKYEQSAFPIRTLSTKYALPNRYSPETGLLKVNTSCFRG